MYDSARSKRYFGVPNIKTPDFFPILSLLPQRALVYVKEVHPQSFVQVFLDIFDAMWGDGLDVSKPELLGQVLSKQFNETEAKDVLVKANSAPYKQRLNDNTKEALDHGAFGCPWYTLRNSKGEEEPFFGSDRFVSPTLAFAFGGEQRSVIMEAFENYETRGTNQISSVEYADEVLQVSLHVGISWPSMEGY
jgi:2-hydroxychromene-2-carboxylate isomerase